LSLLLFDIDGTLLLSGGAGVRAMTKTFEALFGVPDAFAGIPIGGNTDTFLLSTALARANLPDNLDVQARFRTAYLPVLQREIQRPGSGRHGLMPGIESLLVALNTQQSFHLSLLTGNFEPAAQIKLAHFGVAEFFQWGTFGEESANRDDLGRIAMTRARQRHVPSAALERAVVIGDTPHDIACARAAGVRMLAVATGFYSVDELTAAGADVALRDLTDTASVVEMLR
jgi:phosphoglycolate phosphatase-like HAD superfamily hydrolase